MLSHGPDDLALERAMMLQRAIEEATRHQSQPEDTEMERLMEREPIVWERPE